MRSHPVPQRRLVVLHHPTGDDGLYQVLEALRRLSEAGHVSDLLLCKTEDAGAANGRPTSMRLAQGTLCPNQLLDEIAGESSLEHIDIYTMCSSAISTEEQARTSSTARLLGRTLTGLAGDQTVSDIRVYLPSHGDLCPAGGFFSNAAHSNLIVLPEDRREATAFANPLGAGDADVFGWHGAVEFLSLAGLWATMDATPLEGLQVHSPGVDDIPVRLARSFVRCAVSNHPSIQEMLGSADGLPVPVGMQPAPDPFHHASITADHAYPEEFRIPSPQRFDPRHKVEGRQLLGAVAGRLWLDIRQLPRTLRQGFDQEVDAISAITANALVGESAWVQAVWAGGLTNAESAAPLDPSSVLARLERSQHSPTIADISRDSWDRMIGTILGAVDGADAAADARQAAGSRRYLNVDRPALIPESAEASIESSIGALTGRVQSDPVATQAPTPIAVPATHGEDIDVDIPIDETDLSTTPDEDDDPEPLEQVEHPNVDPPEQPTASLEPLDLLSQVTCRFQATEREATNRFESLLDRLRTLAAPEARGHAGVTRITQASLALSAALTILAIATLTPASDRLNFDELSADNRIRMFAIVSALLALPIGLLYVPRDRRRAQVFLVSLLGSITTVMAIVAVFTPEFQVPITGHEIFRWFLAAAITVATVAAATYGLWITRTIEQGWRAATRRVVAAGGALYALSMMIIWINRMEVRPGWIDRNEFRLLLTILLVSLAVFLTCMVMISVVRIQDENHLDLWGAEFRWLVEEIEDAAHRRQVAELLTTHWLGTAVVLLRLIQRPYGEGPGTSGQNASPPADAEGIRKFSAISLQLSDTGRVAFIKRASPLLSPEAWLSAQYRKLTTSFLSEQAISYGTGDENDDVRPEHCAYPMALQDAMAGRGRGVRWPFAYQFYDGGLDHVLRESAEASLARALLDTYLEEPGSWTVASNAQTTQNLSDVFSQILPSQKNGFTAGVLGDQAAAFSGNKKMTAHLWWPANVALGPQSRVQPDRQTEPRGVGSSVLFQAVRVDLSEPILLSDLCPESATVGPAETPSLHQTDRPDTTPRL